MYADRTNRRARSVVVVALTALMAALYVVPSWAHVETESVGSSGNIKARFYWQFPPCDQQSKTVVLAPGQSVNEVHSPGIDGCPAPPADPAARVFMSAGNVGGASSYCLTAGNVKAGSGELGTTAFRTDTLFATDSIRFNINRSGTTVTLNTFSGEMRCNRQPGVSKHFLLVYPDQATADADSTRRTGNGAVFHGVVILRPGSATPVRNLRGFIAGDFTAVNNPDGSVSAVPAGGLSKAVTVPNATTAVVVSIADPGTGGDGALPGASPTGLLLLCLLMLGSGVWLVSRRARQQAA